MYRKLGYVVTLICMGLASPVVQSFSITDDAEA